MKKKIKQTILIFLILSVFVMLVSCKGADTEEKWVLTYEKWTNPDEVIMQERFYEYDTTGKLIGETLDYGVDGVYTCSDFKYDNVGNVIEKTEIYNNSITSDEEICYYTYTYNNSGTLIEKICSTTTEKVTTIYEYDDKGSVIKETYRTSSGEESIHTYSLKYDNDLCIQCEATIKSADYDDEYVLKQYTYDKNGNRECELYYNNTEYDDGNNTTEVNGKCYRLSTIKTYTYEKLSDVAITSEISNSENNILSGTQSTEQSRLSDSCDKLLSSGYDVNNNYYELVANETETYEGVLVEVGVIKNNQWLLEPTVDMPLVDDDKTLYGTSITGLDSAPETIYYIGNTCFLYRTVYSWGWSGKTYQEIVYNVETGKHYELIKVGEIDTNYPTVIVYEDFSIISKNKYYDNGMKVHASDEGLVVWQSINYDRTGVEVTLLDTNTMQTREVPLGKCGLDPKCHPLSEGWFAITNYHGDFKFYDTSGQMVLDLSEYELTHDKQPLFFVDGQCTFTIYNNNNNIYKITIDKKGNVLESLQQ